MTFSVDQVRYEMNQIFNYLPSDIERLPKYRILLTNVVSTWSIEMVDILKEIVEFLAKNNISMFVSRQMFSDLCLKVLPWLPFPQSKLLAHFMKEKMQSREADYDYHLSIICRHLSYIYEKEQNWNDAAYMLVSIPAESFSIDYELELYLKIAYLYMAGDDPLLAEPYVKKVSIAQAHTVNKNIQLNFKICEARLMDFRLEFIEVAQKYYELSHCPLFEENIRLTALKNMIVCTILSLQSGNIRIQLLNLLLKDERCQKFIELSFLEKFCTFGIIIVSEIDHIETLLLPHQKIKTDYASIPILIEAIAEHNILSIKKLYKSIRIESLGHLLKLKPEIAKIIAGRMISEGRIEGAIDHTYGFIRFKSQNLNEL
ncbi:COP9 signalosome complex subunit 4-like [Aphis craccivora]|uniref:COP9 signalosome complex subunit 4 n=1 Tax=Aphis craccivora TaxID=307492 RepID=A0A6G0Y3X4_APHCR|nr:COP9 signalosome complex subunit 4-like [Aphis craccivora]